MYPVHVRKEVGDVKNLKNQQGTTLIEVVITALLLSTCLLAMAIMQKRSLQFNQSAFMRSQANIFAYDIIDRIRLNRGGKDDPNIVFYSVAYGGTPSGNTIAVSDVSDWRTTMARSIPGSDGKIECDSSTKICKIYIKWTDEQIFGDAGANAEANNELIFSTSI